ncbi:MAG: AAA family ATPase, partial [Dehalococcoidia bacterium]
MEIVAIVGMTGAGKSEVARFFEENGFKKVRFGDITDKEIKEQGLEFSEKNERRIREQLRQNYGMAAYAMLNLSRIDLALKKTPVVIDGLYSWEEYSFL